jgi:plastocyanin/methionine-rich copper-binding protein CopC
MMKRNRKKTEQLGFGPALVQIIGITLAVVGFILALTSFNSGCGGGAATTDEQDKTATAGTTPQTTTGTNGANHTFEAPKKSAHYESNTPAHEAVIPAPPINVVINFNFDLAPPSEISITSGGKEYGLGETVIDDGNLSMRRDMDPSAPDGLYDVNYNACWPDGSCHDGHFQFAIDHGLSSTYTDLRGQQEVTVTMTNISFQPPNIIISPGTKVTWVNDDPVEHFVNTDSHPAHTYYPQMNSRGLSQGDTFSATFTKTGYYPYHCSAHPEQMRGTIVVRSVINTDRG